MRREYPLLRKYDYEDEDEENIDPRWSRWQNKLSFQEEEPKYAPKDRINLPALIAWYKANNNKKKTDISESMRNDDYADDDDETDDENDVPKKYLAYEDDNDDKQNEMKPRKHSTSKVKKPSKHSSPKVKKDEIKTDSQKSDPDEPGNKNHEINDTKIMEERPIYWQKGDRYKIPTLDIVPFRRIPKTTMRPPPSIDSLKLHLGDYEDDENEDNDGFDVDLGTWLKKESSVSDDVPQWNESDKDNVPAAEIAAWLRKKSVVLSSAANKTDDYSPVANSTENVDTDTKVNEEALKFAKWLEVHGYHPDSEVEEPRLRVMEEHEIPSPSSGSKYSDYLSSIAKEIPNWNNKAVDKHRIPPSLALAMWRRKDKNEYIKKQRIPSIPQLYRLPTQVLSTLLVKSALDSANLTGEIPEWKKRYDQRIHSVALARWLEKNSKDNTIFTEEVIKRRMKYGHKMPPELLARKILEPVRGYDVIPRLLMDDGYEIPALALSTGMASPIMKKSRRGDWTASRVKIALEAGYRHIYTETPSSALAKNSTLFYVGKVIRNKLRKREILRSDLFVTNKILNAHHYKPNKILRMIKNTLKQLRMRYFDLLLIHWPGQDNNDDLIRKSYLNVWKAAMVAKKFRLTKSIGLSNFNKNQIMRMIENEYEKPTALEVEINLSKQQSALLGFCEEYNITVLGTKPFGNMYSIKYHQEGVRANNPVIVDMALKYRKSVSQLVLGYIYQLGVIPVMKPHSAKKLFDNRNIFNFHIESEDKRKLHILDRNVNVIPVPKYKPRILGWSNFTESMKSMLRNVLPF